MFDELIANHPLFTNGLSTELEAATVRIFQGLGLPFPIRFAPRICWGYVKIGTVYMPVLDDLIIFRTAYEMVQTKQYHQEDVIEWLMKAPTSTPMVRRSYFNIRDSRVVFKEIRLPVEKRIALVYRTTSTTTQEDFPRESDEATGTQEA